MFLIFLAGSNSDLPIQNDSVRLYSSMPVLEDGLSSGHASDTDNNNPTVILMKRQITEIEREINQGINKNKQTNIMQENGLSPTKEHLASSPLDMMNGCLGGYEDMHINSRIDATSMSQSIKCFTCFF